MKFSWPDFRSKLDEKNSFADEKNKRLFHKSNNKNRENNRNNLNLNNLKMCCGYQGEIKLLF